MSRLEDSVKPFLLNLAERSMLIGDLTENQELALSRWASKTAFMIARAGFPSALIPVGAYQALYCNSVELPIGTHVFAFQDENTLDDPINGFQTRDWTARAPRTEILGMNDLLRQTSKISIRVGRLHLLLAYLGDTGLEPVGWQGVHHPLAPTKCRMFLDAGVRHDKMTARHESSLVLFHVSLGVAKGISEYRLRRQWKPDFEKRHEDMFAKLSAEDKVRLA
jgi:hypothetical protein